MASGGQAGKQLVQGLRSDLSLICNEARKRNPAVRESAERGSMKLRTLAEAPGFSLKVLAETDDVVHPLLFAAETKNPRIVQISLTSLQKLMQYEAIPQKSVESIVATLKVLMESQIEELKILQTILLLVTSMRIVRGRSLSKVLELCFKLYSSREPSVHSTAGVAIRQIVTALFDRLSVSKEGMSEEETEGKKGDPAEHHLSREVGDAYLLFQDLCFLTNGDPPAWLPNTLELELSLGLELLETVLREYPHIFMKEKVFNLLLTERICPLIIKLFSPSSKYRHSPPVNTVSPSDKPTFALSVRLLRILSVLIREFYTSLITQCEIFLSMLVRFLDSDKPLWQRTLAMEVLHSFTNHPLLLRSFCEYYDMQEHSSRIFSDIINAVGGFIQTYFSTAIPTTVQLPFGITSSAGGAINSNTGHVTSTATFSSRQVHIFSVRGTPLQVESLPPNSHSKPVFLEMLEKTDVPQIPEGYPLVVAMTALMDAVKSVSLVISDEVKVKKHMAQFLHSSPSPGGDVKEMMLRSSWSGVLASLALLLDACNDEHTTKLILQCFQKFIQLCGTMDMRTPRDAFLTALCKSCLPPKFAMSLITSHRAANSGVQDLGSPEKREVSESDPAVSGGIRGGLEGGGGSGGIKKKLSFPAGDTVSGGPVAGVGDGGGKAITPVSSQKGLQSALVTLKNLQCTDHLLQIIGNHGNLLDTAWLLVLTAVQYINEVFGLSQSQSQTVHENSTLALVSVEKKNEVSAVIDKLNTLFRTTDKLSDRSLSHLVTALCQLSLDGVSLAPAREASLFAMTSLLETGTANLWRVETVWEPISSHLIQVCSCSDANLRGYAADSLSALIRSALSKASTKELCTQLLSPLLSLHSVQHVDVRQKQLECVSNVLHSSGQSLGSSWDVILNVIKAAAALPSEALVRTGFQSLQLVVADFLPHLPPSSLPTTLEVSIRYGLQTVDINISLTSIGLLWNIADYLFQNKETVREGLEALRAAGNRASSKTSRTSRPPFEKSIAGSKLPVFDVLWMLMFSGLSDLCVDERAAVRKSSAQTLFSTISAHGTLLDQQTWEGVLGEVLFPLLERVHTATRMASTSSLQSSSLLIHHSRDSAKKQWAETQVITLHGTARLFQSQWDILVSLPNFMRMWATLLAAIQLCASSTSVEVSVAATNSFLSIVSTDATESKTETAQHQQHQQQQTVESAVRQQPVSLPPDLKRDVWRKAWETWSGIGTECVCRRLPALEGLKSVLKMPLNMERVDQFFISIPSQKFQVNLLEIFIHVHANLKPDFSRADFQVLAGVLHAALPMPVSKDVSPFLVPSANENVMSTLQELVLQCVGVIFCKENVFDEPKSQQKNLLTKKPHVIDIHRVLPVATDEAESFFYPLVLDELFKFSLLASEPPSFIRESKGIPPQSLPFMGVNYVPFGLGAQSLAVQVYRSCVQAGVSLPDRIPGDFLKVLLPALKLKYSSAPSQVWTKSVASLLVVLHTALPPVLHQGPNANPDFWQELATILEQFLFIPIPDGKEISGEKLREYEALDIKLIDLLKHDLLPSSQQAPPEFLQRLTAVLNLGSIHSATDGVSSGQFRESFARACFEALLHFSFVHSQDSIGTSTSHLALNALLDRCEGVLLKFVADEHLSGACPLPRARMNEVALVLKSVTVLISSIKEAQKSHANKVDRGVWVQVSKLYPALVECVTCNSSEVRTALKEGLAQFSDLILTANQ